MLEKKYKNIVYFIAFTISVTIGAQIYWNVKNYELNKQQIINQIQVSFDTAVDTYYNELAKKNIIALNKPFIKKFRDTLKSNNSIVEYSTTINLQSENLLRKDRGSPDNIWIMGYENTDSLKLNTKIPPPMVSNSDSIHSIHSIHEINPSEIQDISIWKDLDSTLNFQHLTAKIMVSFKEDLDLQITDSVFSADISRKNIVLQHGLKLYYDNKYFRLPSNQEYNLTNFPIEYSSIFSHSSFITPGSKLELRYTDMTSSILKRMLGGIILSLILSGIIIGCLLFLLKIIFNQKQLSEVKNDLISNITHEFKTPIATISVALEGLQNFDVINNPEKAKKYLSMSSSQVGKLNTMVEKLLETATLKTDEFDLNKEQVNLTDLLKNCVEKHQFTTSVKQLIFNADSEILARIDKFHFENAISNVLDNAIKYGGDNITVSLTKSLEITIEDNGNGISPNQQKKVFEQFYRIPTGNIHNVKGFGIGLYYTKKIIKKHGGTIIISESKKGKTVFKISLKNE